MKYFCIILILLLVFPFKVVSEEKSESLLRESIQGIDIPDSIASLLKDNTNIIDSLTSENTALKGLLREAERETEMRERDITDLQRKIDDLQNNTIKRLEASNITLQNSLISMASNFLYIPYDEYSIYEIAVPAFEFTKGTSAYGQYQNRITLLRNYKDDIISLVAFLAQAEKDLSIPLAAMRERKASEHKRSLDSLPICVRYNGYDDWKNTYLGIQIRTIQKYLQSPTEGTSAQLKALRTKLESLLNSN